MLGRLYRHSTCPFVLKADGIPNIISGMDTMERITMDPQIMGGHACIRGTRVTVGTIVGMLANGYKTEEILSLYPYLKKEDLAAALSYAAWRADEQEVAVTAG
jgi:uncharacterized protein (DUF433 family)